MLKRLRIKFICIIMGVVLVMLSAIFGLVYGVTARGLEVESLQLLRTVSQEGIPLRPGQRQPCFAVQTDRRGEVFWFGGTYLPEDLDLLQTLADEALAAGGESGVLEGYTLRYYRRSVPTGQLLAFADMSGEQAALRGLVKSFLCIGGAGLLVFFGISLLLARWAVRPVEKAWDQQRQFVADASHELKTPLTVILTNAELLEDPACPEAERARATGSILHMSRQMRGLTEGLLDLARADNGSLRTVFASLDVSELVADALLPFEPLCFERGLELESLVPPNLCLEGSRVHLLQLLDILLDNAVKYASPPGILRVELAEKNGHCLLTVENPGEPIPPEEREAIFKRFYRGDRARHSEGYGLGLSIAETIVHAHRGRIWAESGEHSNRFCVQLPLKK